MGGTLRGSRAPRYGIATLTTLACLAAAPAARAQEDDGTGIRYGAFIFRPALAVAETYDTNIFEQPDDETDSFITSVQPRIGITSDFTRHRLQFDGGVRQDFFHQSSDDNTFTFDSRVGGTLDVTRDFRLRSSIGHRRLAEQRGSDEVDTSFSGPVYSDLYAGSLRAQYVFGDFRIEPFAGVARRDFIDRGEIVDQDDRDRLTIDGGVEFGYRLRTGFEAFISARYFDVDFDDAVDSGGVNRDNSGFETFAGLNLRLSRLVVGTIGGGYTIANFDDPTLEDTGDYTVRAGLDWSPRRRILVNLTANRELDQTSVSDASDKVLTNAALQVQYELLQNLRAVARGGVELSEFNGIDRTDTGYFGGGGLEWSMTRRTSLRLAYNFFRETSTDPDNEYTKHTVILGARYAF